MSDKLHAKVIRKAADNGPNRLALKKLPPLPEPAPAIKHDILQSRIQIWRNTLYAAQVEARVAEAIGNALRQKEAEDNIEQAIRALDELANILAELNS